MACSHALGVTSTVFFLLVNLFNDASFGLHCRKLCDSCITPGTIDITGTAFDADSGVNRVRVRVLRIGTAPALFWNGNAWTKTSAFPDAILDDSATLWTLPNVDLNVSGNYRIRTIAYDNAGNVANANDNPKTDFSVENNDSIKPTAQATSPADTSSITPDIIDISGTSFDADSGVNRVRVRVQQIGVTPLLYWDGSAWTTTSVFLEATLNNTNNATSWTLPNVDLNISGNYRIRTIAYDNAGNVANANDNPKTDFSIE